jgi:hypothetical protein
MISGCSIIFGNKVFGIVMVLFVLEKVLRKQKANTRTIKTMIILITTRATNTPKAFIFELISDLEKP